MRDTLDGMFHAGVTLEILINLLSCISSKYSLGRSSLVRCSGSRALWSAQLISHQQLTPCCSMAATFVLNHLS